MKGSGNKLGLVGAVVAAFFSLSAATDKKDATYKINSLSLPELTQMILQVDGYQQMSSTNERDGRIDAIEFAHYFVDVKHIIFEKADKNNTAQFEYARDVAFKALDINNNGYLTSVDDFTSDGIINAKDLTTYKKAQVVSKSKQKPF